MTHPMDAGRLTEIPDYAGIIKPRPVKGRGGIGGHGNQAPKKTPLKLVSPKQAHRTYELKKKLKRMTLVQELYGYNAHCQLCLAARTDYNKLVLVPDHIGTRNQENADRYENLGVLCWKCNTSKGSVREDYRPEWFKEEMRKLDRDVKAIS